MNQIMKRSIAILAHWTSIYAQKVEKVASNGQKMQLVCGHYCQFPLNILGKKYLTMLVVFW